MADELDHPNELPQLIYRVGRNPDPLSLRPLAELPEPHARWRYDDPNASARYGVIYGAEHLVGTYREVLQDFARDPATRKQKPFSRDWGRSRQIAEFQLPPDSNVRDWIDVCGGNSLRFFAETLQLAPLTMRHIVDGDYRITQAISSWAWEHAYSGIRYRSKMDGNELCWAIFDRELAKLIRVQYRRVDYSAPEF